MGRRGGLAVGIIFGAVFLAFFIPESYRNLVQHHSLTATGRLSGRDMLLLASGPFSLIVATIVAFRHQKIAAWWMIAGGIINALVFARDAMHDSQPLRFLPAAAFFSAPLLLAGILLLLSPRESASRQVAGH